MNFMSKATNAITSTVIHRWYTEKSQTDQRVLQGLLVLTLAMIFFVGIWQPASEFQARERARASTNQGLFEWIALNRSELTNASGRQRSGDQASSLSGPTIANITNSAAQFNIVLSRLQPETDGSVSVSVEQQSFEQLIQWLAELEQKQRYIVERGSIDRVSEEGLVNAQFRFR